MGIFRVIHSFSQKIAASLGSTFSTNLYRKRIEGNYTIPQFVWKLFHKLMKMRNESSFYIKNIKGN